MTGGFGYIGSHTVVELQNVGYEPVVVDGLSKLKETLADTWEWQQKLRENKII